MDGQLTITHDQVLTAEEVKRGVPGLRAELYEMAEAMSESLAEQARLRPAFREKARSLMILTYAANGVSLHQELKQVKNELRRAEARLATVVAAVARQKLLAEVEAQHEADPDRKALFERHARTLQDAVNAAEVSNDGGTDPNH